MRWKAPPFPLCCPTDMYFDLHPLAILQGLILLAIANGSPVFAKKLLGDRCSWPIDGGLLLWDGQPFLGRSKTARGLVIAVLLTTLIAPLLRIDPLTGALAGTGGDLLIPD